MWYLLMLLCLLSVGNADFTCPEGTIQLGSESRCIYVHPTAEYYTWAARKCRDLGGNLVKITNLFETSLIFSVATDMLDASPFIGVEKMANGTWRFSDGSRLNYSNWAPNEPNTSDDANICAILDIQTTKWKAVDCASPRPFFCSIEGDKVMQCPTGWTYNVTFDYCYYLQNFTYVDGENWQLLNWTNAEKNCVVMGSHLASIHSQNEQDFLIAMVGQATNNFNNGAPSNLRCDYSYAWIGYVGDGVVGHGSWSDGTPVDYVRPYQGKSNDTPWKLVNTLCYSASYPYWFGQETTGVSARYLCKQPSAMRALRESMRKKKV